MRKDMKRLVPVRQNHGICTVRGGTYCRRLNIQSGKPLCSKLGTPGSIRAFLARVFSSDEYFYALCQD